ncbi:exocyst complex component EXO70H1-like [Juglans microcarpa x Juglans regia]|uniref:exocyst complex component EXO70H1-like n=1 Tax=Juglans microcarpa x Juglans regia TaxID=2249226 RepID=UPI001B7E83DE|nr:exocyst complex component EXO70H1-like [Juglans microcarpa x Juglans regia]
MTISVTPKNNKLMPRRLMSSLFFSSSKTLSSSYSFPSSHSSTPSTPTHKFSHSMMEENIENAESIISKWDPNSSSYTKVTSLFHHNREEAKEFLKSVKDLRQAMHFLISENSTSPKLTLAQNLMQIAMKRLQKEFYQILCKNRDHLDPESAPVQSAGGSSNSDGEDEVRADDFEISVESITEVERLSAISMTDLKSIAECMIRSGYGKECVKIYNIIRKSIVDEGLYRLGIEKFRSSQIHKMNREDLEHVIKKWMNAIKIAVRRLFNGERVLCDHVFSASETVRELCFSEITKDGAINVFRFPELIAKSKHSLDKIFQLMELYGAISELWPEIELIFDFESTSAIKLQALSSLLLLGDSTRTILSEFESTIQKDSSRNLVFGGGIHPLTQSAMTYISSLADYNLILSKIIVDGPPSATSSLPESYFEIPTMDNGQTPSVSVLLAWLILVLLCKLDSKAELYKDVSLSYLFLANNLHFIVEKVSTTNLNYLLGNDWVLKHAKKVKQYARNYESMAWTKVFSALPGKTSPAITPEMAKECFRKFNAAFEEAYRKQTSWLVQDGKLRDELKVSIAKKLVPVYQEFFDMYLVMLSGEKNLELLVRFSPDDLGNYLSDLFHGTSTSGSSTSTSSLQMGGCLPR